MIDQYQNLVYSICYRTAGNPFDAEDLTQDVFLSAYKKLGDFDRSFEKAWLCKIASNKCLDFLKQAGRRTVPTEDAYFLEMRDVHGSPEEAFLEEEEMQQVFRLCQNLKSPYKEVAVAHFCKEMSAKEIADQTGKSCKTIQTQIYRAKAMLKKQIGRSG